ncbi:MAG: imidazole glycerol phosphate synthase subunit HisH [Bacteroidota bacterium]|nr:imidazole glycerol phosphate synthase subunit HisH [Bacteroidota bacterium]
MLVIIDYGMGNLRSVKKAFDRIGVESVISTSFNDIENASKLILPGVGNFKNGMENINSRGLVQLLNKQVIQERVPILGICLGMQLFTARSEEGNVQGLNWLDAQTVKFSSLKKGLKIPHMGWNNLVVQKKDSVLNEIETENSFYFVHSYYVQCNNSADVLSTTDYGGEFVSSLQKNNITGMQFHPEKSHSSGLKVLRNFGSSSND